jgi:microcystin-dependent protein
MDYFLGQILLFPFNFVPMGFMQCTGTVINIQQSTALFSLISNKFGGNGTTTFAIPDLRNTSPVAGMEYYICVSGIYPTRD